VAGGHPTSTGTRAAPDVRQAFIDLHCHTSASFDSLASPEAVVAAAARRGLTHLAITDHDRIDGARRTRDAAPAGIEVIVGEEIRTTDGDLIAVFLEEAVPPGLPPSEAIAAVRAQGGLVGVPHPFDRFRRSLGREEALAAIVPLVDWIEAWNARLPGHAGNERAADFAREHDVPGVAVSDAHTVIEVGVAATRLTGDPSTPAGLLAALEHRELSMGRATFFVRGWTPIAKLVQRRRGNGRIEPAERRPEASS
jgi:predicted metal-dependent phosphoesterase TrpH